jgi:hypothetical protein
LSYRFGNFILVLL